MREQLEYRCGGVVRVVVRIFQRRPEGPRTLRIAHSHLFIIGIGRPETARRARRRQPVPARLQGRGHVFLTCEQLPVGRELPPAKGSLHLGNLGKIREITATFTFEAEIATDLANRRFGLASDDKTNPHSDVKLSPSRNPYTTGRSGARRYRELRRRSNIRGRHDRQSKASVFRITSSLFSAGR